MELLLISDEIEALFWILTAEFPGQLIFSTPMASDFGRKHWLLNAEKY